MAGRSGYKHSTPPKPPTPSTVTPGSGSLLHVQRSEDPCQHNLEALSEIEDLVDNIIGRQRKHFKLTIRDLRSIKSHCKQRMKHTHPGSPNPGWALTPTTGGGKQPSPQTPTQQETVTKRPLAPGFVTADARHPPLTTPPMTPAVNGYAGGQTNSTLSASEYESDEEDEEDGMDENDEMDTAEDDEETEDDQDGN